MPDTFQAALVTALVVLPGALYTWAFEREVGRWGIGVSDRLLRFVGTSAVFLAIYTYPLYLLWSNYLHRPKEVQGGVVYENLLWQGDNVPGWLFLLPLLYIGLPLAIGSLAATAVNRDWRVLARIAAGRNPSPRAWDFLFSRRPSALVRARLKDEDDWVGGLFADQSYAAGYPEKPEDVYLEEAYEMYPDGSFVRDEEDNPIEIGSGILLKWDEVLHIEFFWLSEDS